MSDAFRFECNGTIRFARECGRSPRRALRVFQQYSASRPISKQRSIVDLPRRNGMALSFCRTASPETVRGLGNHNENQ